MSNLKSHSGCLSGCQSLVKDLKGSNSQYFLLASILSLITFFSFSSAPLGSASENEVVKLSVGNAKIHAEVAANQTDRERGLSGRNPNSSHYFMLFVLDNPQRAEFWMKDTYQSLSIAFISRSGRILEIRSLAAESLKIVRSKSDKVKFALEVPKGYFKNKKIKEGDRLEIPASISNMLEQN